MGKEFLSRGKCRFKKVAEHFKIKEFYPNEEDNLHCLQSAYRMVVRHLSGKEVSLQEAETETGFVKDEATWPYEAILSFAKRGLHVSYAERMDQVAFAKDPEGEIVRCFNQEIWQQVRETSDVERAQEFAVKCVDHPQVRTETRIPTLEDIQQACSSGALVICNVNGKALVGKDGYIGHFVVVEGISEDNVLLQNPGLPPQKDAIISKEAFLSAWYYPDEKAGNIMVVSN